MMNKNVLALVCLAVCGFTSASASEISVKKELENNKYYQECNTQCLNIWGRYDVEHHGRCRCKQACLIAVMREIMKRTSDTDIQSPVPGAPAESMTGIIAQGK